MSSDALEPDSGIERLTAASQAAARNDARANAIGFRVVDEDL